jgi:hypothetical protein
MRRLTWLLLVVVWAGCEKRPAETPGQQPRREPQAQTRPQPRPQSQPRPQRPAQSARRQLPELRIPPHQPGTLLGGELGLDHVAIAVRDLEATQKSYQKLGFGRPSPGKLPNGIQNANYYFKDTTYLETMSAWDAKKAPWLARFTKHHEGAYFLALCVHSAEETAAFLAKRGFETMPPRPGTIQAPGDKAPTGELWKTLFFKRSPFPPGSFFFIAYGQKVRQNLFDRLKVREIRRRYFFHPNTALGIRAVWMGVKDADAVARTFDRMGLPAGRSVELAALGARGKLVEAGIGAILVLEPSRPDGKLAAFLASRGEGLFGLSIQVRHLKMARLRIEQNTGQTVAPVPGFFGPALLLPPELTHGTWMEMSE